MQNKIITVFSGAELQRKIRLLEQDENIKEYEVELLCPEPTGLGSLTAQFDIKPFADIHIVYK